MHCNPWWLTLSSHSLVDIGSWCVEDQTNQWMNDVRYTLWCVDAWHLQEAGNIVALAVDDVQRLMFWANNAREWRAIYRAETSGSSPTPIITTGRCGLVSRILRICQHSCITHMYTHIQNSPPASVNLATFNIKLYAAFWHACSLRLLCRPTLFNK